MSQARPLKARESFAMLAVVGALSLGCITLPWNRDETIDRPDLSGLECGSFADDEPMLGFFWDEAEPIGQGCSDIPIEPGFQGGFHITPIVWMPIETIPESTTGVTRVTVTFLDASSESIVQESEFYDDFWRAAGDGEYISTRVILPNELVEDGVQLQVQLDYEIDFDHPDATDVVMTRQMELYL